MGTWQRPSWREIKIRLHQERDADVLAVIEAMTPGERQPALVRALRAGLCGHWPEVLDRLTAIEQRLANTPAASETVPEETWAPAATVPNVTRPAAPDSAAAAPPPEDPPRPAAPGPSRFMRRLAQAEHQLFGFEWPPEYLEDAPDTRTPEEIERENEELWDKITAYDPYTGRKREGPPPPRPRF